MKKLNTKYSPQDFKETADYIEYVKCVARHIMGVICENCQKNFYLDKLRTNEQLPDTQPKGPDQGLHSGDTISILDSNV